MPHKYNSETNKLEPENLEWLGDPLPDGTILDESQIEKVEEYHHPIGGWFKLSEEIKNREGLTIRKAARPKAEVTEQEESGGQKKEDTVQSKEYNDQEIIELSKKNAENLGVKRDKYDFRNISQRDVYDLMEESFVNGFKTAISMQPQEKANPLVCPKCENPYYHSCTDGSFFCEECDHVW